jgi:hypothetical protein
LPRQIETRDRCKNEKAKETDVDRIQAGLPKKRKKEMKAKNRLNIILALLMVVFMAVLSFSAQAEENDQAAMKSDKTGTNPINFSNDFRIYNEYQWLNTAGDGYQNITTFQFQTPFMDGKWQFRIKTRAVSFQADMNNDGVDELDESGMGDTEIRFLTVPYLNMSKKMAIAFGMEIFFDTASEDILGSGATSLGPQVFAVFFKPFGGIFDLFAPAYQHKFSVDEDDGRSDIHQGLIDVFLLKTSTDKQRWVLLDPQGVLDYENDTEFMLIDVEAGTMLDNYFGTKGHSVYLRPSIGIGSDRPTDGSIEAGYKIIW